MPVRAQSLCRVAQSSVHMGMQPRLAPYMQVAVRVRPPNAQELARGDAQALFVNPSDFRQV